VNELREAPLQVAAATVDLTPRAGLPLGGYLLREGKTATRAHDPLEGSLVWLRDRAEGEVLWIGMDALCADEELAGLIATAVSRACIPRQPAGCAGWDRCFPRQLMPASAMGSSSA